MDVLVSWWMRSRTRSAIKKKKKKKRVNFTLQKRSRWLVSCQRHYCIARTACVTEFIHKCTTDCFSTDKTKLSTLVDGTNFKGALDKYTCIFLYTIEDLKNQTNTENFSWFCRCIFIIRYFVNSIIFRVPHRLLYCVFINWSRLWKIENARNIHISSKISQSRM